MQSFMKKNGKKLGIAVVCAVLVLGLVFGDDILAMMLPKAEELTFVSCELDQSVFDYTGEEKKPEILKAEFLDKDGESVVMEGKQIRVVSYENNTHFGKGDIKIELDGYRGTLTLEDMFQIQPAKVEELQTTQVSEEAVALSWKEVAGAEGYHIYRSEAEGEEFTLLGQTEGGQTVTYQDAEVELNKVYQYHVCAYASEAVTLHEEETDTENVTAEEPEVLVGDRSEILICYTPLAVPQMSEAKSKDYQTIQVQWKAVAGAAGYQVFRSEKKDGEYVMTKEITDGTVTSYTDTACKCGVTYFYYIKAAQKLETETIYGKTSDVISGKTVPNEVSLTGTTTGDGTEVKLTWKKSEGAQGYEIYKKTENGDYKLAKKMEDAAAGSWSDSELSKEKKYTYRIRPYCVVDGNTVTGAYSNTYVKKAVVVTPPAGNSNSSSNTGSSSSDSSSSGSSGGAVAGSIAGVTKYVGVPYVLGGETPSGWDCSGFTKWVMKNYYGVTIPRTAASQGAGGKSVSVSNRSAWQPGDILCFSNGSRISHVGLYLGNNKMMHALNTKYDTLIQDVDYYERWDSGNYLAKVRRYH